MRTPTYAARRRRTTWLESVRADAEVKALDEEHGEWILCATCAAHYEKMGRGRKPNDPDGFKVKMNGRFQEAAWIMHKNRVVAHRLRSGGVIGAAAEVPSPHNRKRQRASNTNQSEAVELQGTTSAESDDADAGARCPDMEIGRAAATGAQFFIEEMKFDDVPQNTDSPSRKQAVQAAVSTHRQDVTVLARDEQTMRIPRTGWKCPGIIPDAFYSTHADLVHAFAKYYVGSYRVNVVRDIRSDRVMLFSHDCENQIVRRNRPHQPIACEKCYDVWLHHKSFRRILKKMERYNQVEDILRHSWSLTGEETAQLSRFKHTSDATLNVEGRKLKKAAIDVLKHHAPHIVRLQPPTAHVEVPTSVTVTTSFDSFGVEQAGASGDSTRSALSSAHPGQADEADGEGFPLHGPPPAALDRALGMLGSAPE